MPSVDGLKKWFDYELAFIGLAIAFLVVSVGVKRLAAFLGRLPLSSPEFTIGFIGVVLGLLAVLLWLAGRFNR